MKTRRQSKRKAAKSTVIAEAETDTATSGPVETDTGETSGQKRRRAKRSKTQTPKETYYITSLNQDGKPVEPKVAMTKFSTTCGVVARTHGPLNVDSWEQVDDNRKNFMWNELQKWLVYPPGSEAMGKEFALKTMAHRWRQWKSDLNTHYVQQNKTPFADYGGITTAEWDTFVAKMTSPEALARRKKMSDLAKRNKYPHRLGSSGYDGHVEKWRATEEKFAAQGKPLLVDALKERSKNWVWARSTGQVTDAGEIQFENPDIERVTSSLKDIAEKGKTGEFIAKREHDQLTAALGNPEHSGRVRGLSSRTSWKEGFPEEAKGYKKRDRYKQKLEERIAKQVEQHFYSLVAQNRQAFPQLFQQSEEPTVQVPSSVGSVDTAPYPVDNITGPTPCSLLVPIGRAGKRKEVGTGLAIPGREIQNTLIPEEYARVQVAKVHAEHTSLEIDIPTPDGIQLLGDAVNQFILWHRRDILLVGPSPSTPHLPAPKIAAAPAPPSPPGQDSPTNRPASPHPTSPNPLGPGSPHLSDPEVQAEQPPLTPQSALALPERPLMRSASLPSPTKLEPRRLIPTMIRSTYDKEKMAVYEERLVFQAFRGRASTDKKQDETPHLSDSQKSVKNQMEDLQNWTSDEVPTKYVHGKPFLPPKLMEGLPWEMRLMHDWYLKASKKGLGMITVKVPDNAFTSGPNGMLVIDFNDLHALFKLDKMDINLVAAFCL